MATGLLGVGESITLSFVWFDDVAPPADAPLLTLLPAPTLVVTKPDGTVLTPALTPTQRAVSSPYWDVTFTPDVIGLWNFQPRCEDTDVGEQYTDPIALWVTADSLSDIQAKTDLITQGAIQYSAPVAPVTGRLTLVQSQDYLAADGGALPEWTNADWAPFDLSNAISVTWSVKTKYNSTVTSGAVNVISDTELDIRTFVRTVTALFTPGTDEYRLQVWAVLDVAHGSAHKLLVNTSMTIVDDLRS